ncbi:MAG TPA: MATE family efflux transporter [Accumulibacter sp.]|uniref:MATE family efflux transporter n=3 Tax=Accumulibacter sp. TaxID=2053492 RepID=UPI00287A8C83|nr:MATE family efflux transporter [Accumulibacter sp.]HNN09121.1 MATE family efflux transporter [Azospira sp.]MDS4053780.1 MATE family efflux transporter [Accumulibacter sp.]HMV05168.1 MATE family efflux transporter [Accumulibacter sp.]HNB67927.1 MATE family efflux transporter [Accumulibacter sp.]HNC26367.1 MATE family efflux transporter [Accumulibacter sp.]
MLAQQSRLIVAHAAPILIAQLASMGMMVIDTALLGHYGTDDLAAVAVGGGVYISVVFAFVGILQAVAPTVAHLHGAGRTAEIAPALQQGFWLAVFLAVPGVGLLLYPDLLLGLSRIDPPVEQKARAYLALLAGGLPAVLLYRTFHAFCNALGHPRPLLVISLAATLLHALLAWLLVTGSAGGAPLGVLGCGWSNVAVAWFSLFAASLTLRGSARLRPLRVFAGWQLPRLRALVELLRLGLPMGFSNFVEISSFTLMALFVAQLGATVVAGHRIVANLAALCYMLPLALAIATLAQVAQAAGGRDWARAHASIKAGFLWAGGLSAGLGVLLWLVAEAVTSVWTDDAAVSAVAVGLLGYVAVYQVFDAVQTIAAHALRGYKITFVPMFVHLVCFWGVGLLGGWWLAFHAAQPLGVAGFWLASLLSLVLAAILLGALLRRAMRAASA